MDTADLKSAQASHGADPFGVRAALKAAILAAPQTDAPYRHWIVSDIFTPEAIAAMKALPRHPIDVKGVSGKRELHNDERHYFDQAAIAAHPVCKAVADAFQSPEIVRAFEAKTGAKLTGTYLRLEHAHDIDGFWLEPHTDLGVKMITLLCFLPDSPDQADLGTDMYADAKTWVKRAPFEPGTALMFVPNTHTWHGWQKRPIKGVRSSLIMNYVTDEWRAREQLSFPNAPVTAA